MPVSIMFKHNTDSHFPTPLAPRAFRSLLRNTKVVAFRFPDLPLHTTGRSDNSLIIYVPSQGLPNETQRFLLTHLGALGRREAICRLLCHKHSGHSWRVSPQGGLSMPALTALNSHRAHFGSAAADGAQPLPAVLSFFAGCLGRMSDKERQKKKKEKSRFRNVVARASGGKAVLGDFKIFLR